MKHGKIIKGEQFDWKQAEAAQRTLIEAAGVSGRLEQTSQTLAAAMRADPGVCKCPMCLEYLWREGEILECPECQSWFAVRSGKLVTSPRRQLPRFGLDPKLADSPEKARERLNAASRAVLTEDGPCGGNEVSMSAAAFRLAVLWMVVEGQPDEIIEIG